MLQRRQLQKLTSLAEPGRLNCPSSSSTGFVLTAWRRQKQNKNYILGIKQVPVYQKHFICT